MRFIQIALANNKSERKALLFCLEQYTISCAGFISPHFRCCWCKNPQQRLSFISAFLYHSSRLSSSTEQANLNSFNGICPEERRQSAAMPVSSLTRKRAWGDQLGWGQMKLSIYKWLEKPVCYLNLEQREDGAPAQHHVTNSTCFVLSCQDWNSRCLSCSQKKEVNWVLLEENSLLEWC